MIGEMLHHAWQGPFRRPVRSLFHRLDPRLPRIAAGPLRGMHFPGPEAPCRLGIYEFEVQLCLRELIIPGETVYDLGANNGFLSLLAAVCVGPQGMVCSFEPLPENAERINELMRINRITQQKTLQMAVAERAGRAQFFVSAGSSGRAGGVTGEAPGYTPSLIRQDRRGEIEVEVTTIDDFAASHPPPDLVKMDIEGAEVMALAGSRRLLAERPPRVWLIEVHSDSLDREVRAILGRCGYAIDSPRERWRRKEYPRHLLARLS